MSKKRNFERGRFAWNHEAQRHRAAFIGLSGMRRIDDQ